MSFEALPRRPPSLNGRRFLRLAAVLLGGSLLGAVAPADASKSRSNRPMWGTGSVAHMPLSVLASPGFRTQRPRSMAGPSFVRGVPVASSSLDETRAGSGEQGRLFAEAGSDTAGGDEAASTPSTFDIDDPLEELYRPALRLDGESRPVVGIRLMSGQTVVRVRASGGAVVVRPRVASDEPRRTVRAPSGTTLSVEVSEHRAGRKKRFPIVADLPAGPSSEDQLVELIRTWSGRDRKVRLENVGSIFGLGGRVVDNRRSLVLIDGPGDARWAQATVEEVSAYLDQTPVLHEVRMERPSATLLIRDEEGGVLAQGADHVSLEVEDGGNIEVLDVEHGVGYSWHGREDRAYEGEVHLVTDDSGLSVVNVIPLETLLRGLVPAETYASAHIEALKAQAVTARTEILAKVGTRHLADPALICAETHCQVYRGSDAAVGSTDAAISMTRGEVLIRSDGRLVDAVYSAMCGGHTESNEVVWGTPPDPALRGRLDMPAEGEWMGLAAGIGEEDLELWLSRRPPSWCNLSSLGSSSRFRWTRRMTSEEIDELVAHLGVGSVERIEVTGRGVSGRVRGVRIVGDEGVEVIRRELPVRRLFSNLESGMFIVEVEKGEDGGVDAFVFRGGGWGHGVGMCQTGAIGMAEHGHPYDAILRHYYNGATVASLY